MLTYTDTGDQFIFNGKTWDTFVGAEDLLGILIEIAGFLDGQTPLLRAIVCGMNHLTGLDLAEEVQEQTD